MDLMDFQVKIIRDINQLYSGTYAQQYTYFIERLAGYSRLEYCTDWLKITSPLFIKSDDCLFFISVSIRNEIVAIAPFYLENYGKGAFSFRRLHLWGKGCCYIDYPIATILSLCDYKEQCIDIIINSLRTTYRSEFDEINLTRADPNDPFIKGICSKFKLRVKSNHGDQLHLFTNSQNIDNKLKGENIRRIRKEIERLTQNFGEVDFSCQSALDDLMLEEIRQLHIRRQNDLINNGRLRISIFEDPVENEAVTKLIRYNQSINAMRAYTLRLDGRLLGFWLCFHFEGYTQAFLTAFSPIPEHKYAASCLWRYMYNEELVRFNTHAIDSGVGTHILKRKFCNHLVNLRSYNLLNQYSLVSLARQYIMYVLRQCRNAIKWYNAQIIGNRINNIIITIVPYPFL